MEDNPFLKKFITTLGDYQEKSNLHSLSNYMLSTDLYKNKAFIEQVVTLSKRIQTMIKSLTNVSEDKLKSKLYALALNKVITEIHFLKSTLEAMDDNLQKINKYDHVQHQISGKLIHLRKDMNKFIQKSLEFFEKL